MKCRLRSPLKSLESYYLVRKIQFEIIGVFYNMLSSWFCSENQSSLLIYCRSEIFYQYVTRPYRIQFRFSIFLIPTVCMQTWLNLFNSITLFTITVKKY